jgi:hypothetical protein
MQLLDVVDEFADNVVPGSSIYRHFALVVKIPQGRRYGMNRDPTWRRFDAFAGPSIHL